MIVSHHSMRAVSCSCRNMFIRQSAQVLPFASWPKSEKFLLGLPSSSFTSLATRISSEPEPQAGSQIRSPGFGPHELRQQRRDFRRRVELARLLARAGGELADQVFVHVADDVALPTREGRRSSAGR